VTTATLTTSQIATGTSGADRWAKVAGLGYAGAWILGLTAFGAGPSMTAAGSQVDAYFAGHRIVSATQGFLIHGIAAVALLAVLVAVQRSGLLTRPARFAGVTAVALSVVQCVLDVWRSLFSTGATTASLVHTIDRIDGFKMLALSVMIATSVAAFRSAGLVGTKMALTGRVAAGALVLSGIGYALANVALATVADLSLVLLLVWVAYTGVAVARSAR
jgi:hypothetical protein